MYQKLEARTFLLFLFVVSIGFLLLLKPFFSAIFWACAIAIIFNPLQKDFLRRFNNRKNLSSALTLVICIIIVILPVIFLVTSVVTEGSKFYSKLESGELNPAEYVEQIRTGFPVIPETLGKFGIDVAKVKEGVLSATMSSGKWLAQHALSIGQNTFGVLLDVGLMLYVAFFLLRDGNYLIELMIRALPLGDARERLLFTKFGEVTRATIKGNMVIAIVQGSLGGIIFWVLGIPGALLWGVIMALFSLIPAVGSAIVWGPVAIYLFATGATAKGIILVVFGMVVIGLIDNILRPILVGRDTKLPDYIVLLSTLGGLSLFGINGFVFGPLVAALFITVWGIFMGDFNNGVQSLTEESLSDHPLQQKIVTQYDENKIISEEQS